MKIAKAMLIAGGTFWSTAGICECVHELSVDGWKVNELTNDFDHQAYINIEGRYIPASQATFVDWTGEYKVQLIPRYEEVKGNRYYDYSDFKQYISERTDQILNQGYSVAVVGQSLENRDLYAIFPNELSQDKKTIVMLGRQHGNEHTQNWIIEGFLDRMFETSGAGLEEFQLIAYPMINPDGAVANKRYNSSGLDLNRQWRDPKDEIVVIRAHLERLLDEIDREVFLFIDMHGAPGDFVFRVKRNYLNLNFFEIQSQFVEALGNHDRWQAGRTILSNGKPGMARMTYIDEDGFNAMTHETLVFRPSALRSTDDLRSQGHALFRSLSEL